MTDKLTAVLLCRSKDPDAAACVRPRGHGGWLHKGALGQMWSGGINTPPEWRTTEHPSYRKEHTV